MFLYKGGIMVKTKMKETIKEKTNSKNNDYKRVEKKLTSKFEKLSKELKSEIQEKEQLIKLQNDMLEEARSNAITDPSGLAWTIPQRNTTAGTDVRKSPEKLQGLIDPYPRICVFYNNDQYEDRYIL